MQLSIRDASQFVIGSAVLRDMATKNAPDSGISFENIAVVALRDGPDGDDLRTSISKLAEQEAVWFRSTFLHTLSTPRVMQTREQEVHALNSANMAALATLEFGPQAQAGEPEAKEALQARYQTAIRAIDEMPGGTAERRTLLQSLKAQSVEACGEPGFVTSELNAAQKTYLERLMAERLAAYQNPSLDRSDDLDLGM